MYVHQRLRRGLMYILTITNVSQQSHLLPNFWIWEISLKARQKQPISRLIGRLTAKQLLFTLLFHFCSKDFDIFSKYFLKWMWNSSFSTSITYSLTPSTSNLVKVEVQIVHKEVYLEVEWTLRMARTWADFSEVSVTAPPIGREIGV